MFRVHQFDKVEMFVFTEPGRSSDEHEALLALEEELVQEVGLPYRVVNVAAGDLGASAAKKYDIEAWFPGQQRYREITSTSNTTDYQARRLGIRFRREGKLEPVHTLNGTAMTARWLIALLENFQDEGGEIAVPEVLTGFGAPHAWPRLVSGGVPERTNGAVLKTAGGRKVTRGFESHPRRLDEPKPAPLSGGFGVSRRRFSLAFLECARHRDAMAPASRPERQRSSLLRRIGSAGAALRSDGSRGR